MLLINVKWPMSLGLQSISLEDFHKALCTYRNPIQQYIPFNNFFSSFHFSKIYTSLYFKILSDCREETGVIQLNLGNLPTKRPYKLCITLLVLSMTLNTKLCLMETYLKSVSKNTFTQPVVFSPITTEDLSALSCKAFCVNDSSPCITSNGIKTMRRKIWKVSKTAR